jgi:hypothetical protein
VPPEDRPSADRPAERRCGRPQRSADQTEAPCALNGVGAVAGAELALGGTRVLVDGVPRQVWRPRDLVVRRSGRDAREHVLGPLISVLNPDLVLIGGEVGQNGFDVVKSPLLQALKRHTMRPALRDVEVVGATLQRRTALQGAIALVLRTGR